jgi:type II secretory pathway predicted ATPase ExeA
LSRCPILSPKVRNDIADQAKRASVEEAHRLLAEVLELLRRLMCN